jgi:hypothetical protein
LDAGDSPPKAPLQAVSEKNSSPRNTRRIVDGPNVAFRILLARILVEYTAAAPFGTNLETNRTMRAIEHPKQHEGQGAIL